MLSEKMPLKEQLHAEQSMVRALLADRFKLQTHHELRRLAVYAAGSGEKQIED